MKRKKTSILDDEQLSLVTKMVRAVLPGISDEIDASGQDVETAVRMISLQAECTETRERLGLSIKDVARKLGVTQREVKLIESGAGVKKIEPAVLSRYVALLGLKRFVKRWAAANPELAAKLGLA